MAFKNNENTNYLTVDMLHDREELLSRLKKYSEKASEILANIEHEKNKRSGRINN